MLLLGRQAGGVAFNGDCKLSLSFPLSLSLSLNGSRRQSQNWRGNEKGKMTSRTIVEWVRLSKSMLE
jgi:hypothetical protein